MFANKGIRILVIMLIKTVCIVKNFSELANQQQQFDLFENETVSNLTTGFLEFNEKSNSTNKRSINYDGDDEYGYLNIGVLMASHLGK